MSFSEWALDNIDAQGYRLTRDEKTRLALPMRFPSGILALLALIFVIAGSSFGLYALAASSAVGAIFRRHPFDYLYGYLLAQPMGTAWAPTSTPQRQFAHAAGVVLLGAPALLFASGHGVLATLLGLFYVGISAAVAASNWCLRALIYNRLFLKGRSPLRRR